MKYISVGLISVLVVMTGCANQDGRADGVSMNSEASIILPSYLKDNGSRTDTQVLSEGQLGPEINKDSNSQASDDRVIELQSIKWPGEVSSATRLVGSDLSSKKSLSVAAEKMSARDFTHYIFGDLLSVNYILDESINAIESEEDAGITLSTAEDISPRDLFNMTAELLSKRNIKITFSNKVYYIHKPTKTDSGQKTVIGIGGNPADVPNTSLQPILQVVPLEYGVKISVERTLRSLTKAKITPDFEQSVVFLEGERQDIIHAIELIQLLDTPASRSQHVGLIKLAFVSPDDFSTDISALLESEGIEIGVTTPKNKNIVVVPLRQLGGIAVFAVSEQLLNRVRYWAQILDVPGEGSDQQYFVYTPKNARAVDLGQSIGALLGVSGQLGSNSADSRTERSTGSAPSARRVAGVSSDDLRMVVDERTNALIFYTTGSRYRELMPMLSKLDLLPKQVALDIIIAEVNLQDEFKYGVEWALSRSEVNLTTSGAFGVSGIGGMGLIINGTEGPITANFLNSNSLVNVLSRPTIIVRDGVPANINVGSDISVVGQTTQDPINGERQTTSSEYRKTGLDVSVTPTINSNNVVTMVVNQKISNSVPDSSGSGGNPDIFERSISTELVAGSGQTVMMAGLISESSSNSDKGAPLLNRIPLLGGLFESNSKSTDRTELIMLITPRVIATLDNWDAVMSDFQEGLRSMNMDDSAQAQ
ncbi:hypothetical protein N9R68_02020 [Porticoccaceae bacterium]|nr:hypothetical protein [Porticoccaceae bacterium]MDB2383115.1 hypothetical protein [Porticoccaceae bacterium]MDB2566861.1 hypothetical protein [Porticoccaceae bacterium]MDB2669531.1 hypothetical protein [Porticoccaceae bacterium]